MNILLLFFFILNPSSTSRVTWRRQPFPPPSTRSTKPAPSWPTGCLWYYFRLIIILFFSVSLTGEKSRVALRTGGWRPAGTTWCAAAARPAATSRGATGGMRPLLPSRWRWRVRPAWAPSPWRGASWRGASWRWRLPQNQPLWAKRRRAVGQVRQTNEHPCWNKNLSGGSSLQLTGRTPLISSASYWSTALLCGAGVALAALVLASVAFCRKTQKSVSYDVPTWSEAIKAFLTEFSRLILFFSFFNDRSSV